MSPSNAIKRDEWLSNILNKACYNLNSTDFYHLKSEIDLNDTSFFIQTKVKCDEIKPFLYLQKVGFKVIDTNVIFDLDCSDIKPSQINSPYHLLLADDQYRDEVYSCAKGNFTYTRYHLDPNINSEQANILKAEWASNYFKGQRGQKMIIALHENKVVGFCQILEPNPETRVIDLIAVDNAHRRKGLAQAMISHHLDKEKKIIVGTQVSNIPSIRCYESMGFRLINSQYVLHYHN